MIVSSASQVSPALLALALAKGVKYAKLTFLADVKAYAYQTRAPEGVAPYASPEVLSGAYGFRVELKGDVREAHKVYNIDERHVARGLSKLLAMDAGAFGRIADGKGKVADCVALLQLATFGYERFDSEA